MLPDTDLVCVTLADSHREERLPAREESDLVTQQRLPGLSGGASDRKRRKKNPKSADFLRLSGRFEEAELVLCPTAVTEFQSSLDLG